ncbi:MAG: S-layer protein, partial [Verrucomicrobiota bacterium]|nr:S-layer protein [Verrucomicrobiota bacterium]
MKTNFLLGLFCATLTASAAERPISFRHDVLPVISKVGCNSGGCHGALAGKNGFRLSLNAYDPASDHYNITREIRGRRVEFSDPARSLFLIKPTAAVRHKGGKVLHEDSVDYQLLVKWIQQGAAGPTDADVKLQRVELSPGNSKLKKGDS